MRFSPGSTDDGCRCGGCRIYREIATWGADTTTIGNGATEQNGNWEILSGKLRVTTADAVITWDATAADWTFLFDLSALSWNTTGGVSDWSKELRFIWNYVDNSNYDFCSLRLIGALYLLNFSQRIAGVETILNPPAGGGPGSKQFKAGYNFAFVMKSGVLYHVESANNGCPGGDTSPDSPYGGRSFARTVANNIVGIGTGPSWTGNLDVGPISIASPSVASCAADVSPDLCWFPTRPTRGCLNATVAKTITCTIAGTPYTCYQRESNGTSEYYWDGTAFVGGPYVSTNATGQVLVFYSGDSWTLSNGGSPRTDCDAWTSLNIPPDAPNVKTCTLTGNY